MNRVFEALADPSRRRLLDALYETPGLRLTELCPQLEMSRQAVSKHLGILEAAGLVVVAWKGRDKHHYLNPLPLRELYSRWIRKFDEPRKRLSYSWESQVVSGKGEGPTTVLIELEEMGPLVKLSILHDIDAASMGFKQAAAGWTIILSGIKTLLETGAPLPSLPWKKG